MTLEKQVPAILASERINVSAQRGKENQRLQPCVPVELGPGCQVDSSALLGHPTGRRIELRDELGCPFGIVQPYVNGVAVRNRPEWETVAALPRPIQRPAKKV